MHALINLTLLMSHDSAIAIQIQTPYKSFSTYFEFTSLEVFDYGIVQMKHLDPYMQVDNNYSLASLRAHFSIPLSVTRSNLVEANIQLMSIFNFKITKKNYNDQLQVHLIVMVELLW